jgi:tRNA1(Val) A37 N6-methylase TrmN6
MLYQSLENKFSTIIQEMKNKKGPLITELNENEINEYIIKNLGIKKQEKDEFGEVFTPPDLIEEMLGKLPLGKLSKSVWKNKDYKWLDPANGIGNFPMMVYFKLMKELDSVPLSKRSEHIIKNMLYMVELNPKNAKISRKIFGKDANILCMSFLSDDYKSVNPKVIEKFKEKGVEKFDVIMGNPPFQKEQSGTRKGSYGGRTLWNKFIESSFTLLKENGYLTFINPANWRGLGELNYLWEIMSKKQLLYLHIYSKKQGQKLFNVGQRFDLYILKNTNNTKQTEIKDELGNIHSIDLTKMQFLPNYAYNEINSILTDEQDGTDVIYSSSFYDTRKLKSKPQGKYIYPVVHSITKEGITYWYSNDNTKGHFGVPKVILNFNENQYSHKEQNDYKGEYGMSQISFGIPIKSKKEGDEILKAIDSDAFKKIIAATKWGAFQTDYRMFKYFKKDFFKHPMFTNKAKTYSKPKSKSKSPGNKTKKFNTAGKVINRKTIKKPKNKKKGRTIKRKFWF